MIVLKNAHKLFGCLACQVMQCKSRVQCGKLLAQFACVKGAKRQCVSLKEE